MNPTQTVGVRAQNNPTPLYRPLDAAEATMGHSPTTFGIESINNYPSSRLDYLRAEYLKSLNNLSHLEESRGIGTINREARWRTGELEVRLAALKDAVKFYETFT
jgi:hypothetical protein